MAFLLVLERLSPVERAVFLLHDVFAYDYDEIAGIVGKSEANCRQLASRARRHLEAEKPRFEASRREREQLAGALLRRRRRSGDVDGLVDAARRRRRGLRRRRRQGAAVGPADRRRRPRQPAVRRASGGRSPRPQLQIEPHTINGQPGAIVRTPDGEITNVFALDIADGVVQTVRSVINPDKLRHLGPVADVWALARRRSRTDD